MSTTLGTLLRELDPSVSMLMVERLGDPAQESSDGWNNAGTGHAANCEMNYTPEREDGSIDISKALEINVEFDISRQLWAHLVKTGSIPEAARFIQACPHLSFVTGRDNVAFLKKRHAAMSATHNFADTEYTEDRANVAEWVPFVMEDRDPSEPIAARLETLKTFYPDADADDWRETVAGQRVEVIKPDGHGGGTLQLGTELVVSADKGLMVLMGASPGASTAASIALDTLEKGFAEKMREDAWLPKLRQMIPTFGIDLKSDAEACRRSRAETAPILGLQNI